MYASSASDRCLGIVNRPSDPRRKRRNLFLIEACCSFPNAKEAGMTPTGKSETAWDRWRNATRRYERNTRSVKQTSHGLIARSICIHGISDFISRESSSVSHLSPFLMYLHRYSSPPLNERLIPCLSVCPFRYVSSLWLPREIACRLARSPVPSLHRISISVFHSIARHISALSTPRGPHSSSLYVVDFPLPLPASILSPIILPLSRSVHEKKNGEKRPWLGMESLAAHLSTRLIPPFFTGIIGCTARAVNLPRRTVLGANATG